MRKATIFWADDSFAPSPDLEDILVYRVKLLEENDYEVRTHYVPDLITIGQWLRGAKKVPSIKFLILDQIWPKPLGPEGGMLIYTNFKDLIQETFDGVVFYTKNPTPELRKQVEDMDKSATVMYSLIEGPDRLVKELNALLAIIRKKKAAPNDSDD